MSKCPMLSHELPQVSITDCPSFCQKSVKLLIAQCGSTEVFVEFVIHEFAAYSGISAVQISGLATRGARRGVF